MNYHITCVCGHKFLIADEQLSGHVICPACKRALSPVVTPAPETAPAVPAGNASTQNLEGAVTTSQESTPEPTKRCPFCGEVILAIAKKCKHCGEFLDRAPADALTGGPAGQAAQAEQPAADAPPVFELTVSQWDNFWRFLICLVITVGVCFVLIKWVKEYAAIGVPLTLVVMATIAWFFYVSARNSKCIIRPMRIETEVGVLSKDMTAVDLFRVTDLELKQGIVERLLGIGTIRVTSSDTNTPELILYEIPQARKVYKYLQQQVPVAAKQRGALYVEK